jgi:hypothetical protein
MYFKGGSLFVVYGGGGGVRPRVLRNTTHAPTGDSNNNINSTTSRKSTLHDFLKIYFPCTLHHMELKYFHLFLKNCF